MEHRELISYSNYNLHANHLIMDLLKKQPPELLEKEIESSFPSLIKTVGHIWDAEYVWLERIKGISPKGFLSPSFEGNSYELIDATLNTSANFNAFVQTLDKKSLVETLEIKTTSGYNFAQSRYQMIHHCINHSTQHRGQLITMCRQVGIKDFKALDYIWYLRNKEGQEK